MHAILFVAKLARKIFNLATRALTIEEGKTRTKVLYGVGGW